VEIVEEMVEIWPNEVCDIPLVEILHWSAFVFSKISFEGQGRIGGGTLLM